ncbi:MAG: glycosyltransferase [Deltaproteobacteria bacterium]|nr:glycosyltransferase [Deltaproteobacteria bacterium]
MLASIVIRTLDEERHLQALLEAIESQESEILETEVVLIDSGSTDRSLEIASSYGCRIEHIGRDDFSFGRSLNRGCAAGTGDILVFVSGHCVPLGVDWLERLTAPIASGEVSYAYGRQIGGPGSRYSESRLFAKQYPEQSRIPQQGFFCNNANAALLRSAWEKEPFDEESSGLEDMDLAKRLVDQGQRVGYVAEAPVIHHHDESWQQVRWRFEREALALQSIMPEIHLSVADLLRYFLSAVLLDHGAALQERRLAPVFFEVLAFRWQQYLGSYRGNHEHRKLSKRRKEHYFFPKNFSKEDRRHQCNSNHSGGGSR